jgi:hypothetical protein
MSGVVVASTMRSMSAAETPAAAMACSAAFFARSLVSSPSATRRDSMPVRATTQSWDVATPMAAISWLVTTFGGR